MPPPNDPSIADDDILFRRVFPGWYVEADGALRLSAQAFEDSPDASAMSVHALSRLLELGLTPEHLLNGYEGYGLVALPAGRFRASDMGFGIVWSPDLDDGLRGQAHAEVHCNKTRSKRRELAKAAEHVAGPLAA